MDLASARTAPPASKARGSWGACLALLKTRQGALAILTLINLFNYVDRYVPSATKELIKRDLRLSDAQTAMPLSAFMVVYMICSPIFGTLADRGYSRRMLIACGVVIWSLATALGGLATSFATFLLARAFVGVGEAAYATIAPVLLAELYPADECSRMLAVFYSAIPIGAAMGYLLGGWVGGALGWRAAFFVAGLPGLALAGLIMFVDDTPARRGGGGGGGGGGSSSSSAPVSWAAAVRQLLGTPSALLLVGGQTCVTWAAGGMADWMPAFLQRQFGLDVQHAGTVVGGVTVVAGVLGTLSGPLAVRRLAPARVNGNFAVPALSMVPTTLFALAMLFTSQLAGAIVMLLLAQYFLWFFQGPTNAELAACVAAPIRTRTFALAIFVSHAFGDAISPTVIGALSDGLRSLRAAMVLVPCFFAAAGLFWLAGVGRVVARQTAREAADEAPDDELGLVPSSRSA